MWRRTFCSNFLFFIFRVGKSILRLTLARFGAAQESLPTWDPTATLSPGSSGPGVSSTVQADEELISGAAPMSLLSGFQGQALKSKPQPLAGTSSPAHQPSRADRLQGDSLPRPRPEDALV